MDNQETIRINRYLSDAGFCSRRAADKLVEEGRVTIDGQVALMGCRVLPNQVICVDGKTVQRSMQHQIYAFYKPVGYISSLSDEQGEGINSFLKMQERVYPVGRLDKDSEGLMLLTNDGDLMNTILKASNGHEKEYEVTVNRSITDAFLKNLAQGVEITNAATGERVMTAPAKVTKLDDRTFHIIIVQGMNRQIRRMCGAFSYQVKSLKRVRIMGVELGDLKPGELREVTRSEVGL